MTKNPKHASLEGRATTSDDEAMTTRRRAEVSSARAEGATAGQRGYALVALLALMTLIILATMAAAPSIRQQTRRELEREAIARGEEVAEAIRIYIHLKGTPPTSMEELVEGVAPPGVIRKRQILRASAARDPLSSDGEWRLIKANDREFAEFIRAVTLYSNGRLPVGNDKTPAMLNIANSFARLTSILSTGSSDEASGGEDTSMSSKGPFVGVASRSRHASILTYYDIERHDKWVFTPFFK